jgi:hypothetical protein
LFDRRGNTTDNITPYIKVKLMLGITSLIIGVAALVFALFGWSQTAQPLFGIYNRYVCIFGSSGAMIMGTLLANESLALRKNLATKQVSKFTGKSALDFQVVMEKEEEEPVTT